MTNLNIGRLAGGKHKIYARHKFNSLEDLPFEAKDYSHLKFGSHIVAKQFGYALAEGYFKKHGPRLLTEPVVVIPSPYNNVRNAATVLTDYFVDRLNQLLVDANGTHAERGYINRKVSYTSDYGTLTKERRAALIANDEFSVNVQHLQGKHLIFVDDIKITGTHEEKLRQLLQENSLENYADFVYFAQMQYVGQNAEIESQLNFASIKTVDDYLRMLRDAEGTENAGMFETVVRVLKLLLGAPRSELNKYLEAVDTNCVENVVNAALGEGYYRIPAYAKNLIAMRKHLQQQ